ncbi:USH1C-binding protein 1 [uncultured Desulfovibrio sp.]|uniref:USH1C-binding protein 1 n=1 Tax=uncultured Desulfovibrio sp. TaxID=167968 RepID=UPI002608574A|nr:USH1C-binding protein 1 [uncultured Desulfovibrio sp.]
MSQVTFSSTSSVSLGELGPTTSLQLMFAQLQLELAETAKSQAMGKMEAISEAQDEQKLVSQLLNEARQAQADAKAGVGNDADKTATFNVPKKDADGNVMVDDSGNIIYETSRTETVPKGNNATFMSQEMVDYMELHGLAMDRTANNYSHSADEWDVAITSLESRLEELGTNTQQEMVYIQDYMGQYNSYLQGANTQIANANQTLTSLARGQ